MTLEGVTPRIGWAGYKDGPSILLCFAVFYCWEKLMEHNLVAVVFLKQWQKKFPEVAELIRVRWLEVHAKMETRLLSADTYYAAYFIFKFVHGNYGFETQAVEVSISCGSAGEQCYVYFDPDGRMRQQYQTVQERSPHIFRDATAVRVLQAREKKAPRDRGDGWKEINLGEFFVDDPPTGEVQISLMDVKSLKWKSGLVIQGIELRPTQMTSQESSRQRR
ncbi:hypothetical protein ACJRO7_030702 [Eucalyptus globulus]|uniref:Uncharacterized protein n=1 Tax=Eucalyptus globulus TaxID=34317 RepID=A0ABD3JQ86_EUCGL